MKDDYFKNTHVFLSNCKKCFNIPLAFMEKDIHVFTEYFCINCEWEY